MTEKEKAKELVEKYSQLLYKSTFDELHFTLKRIVKQCALIAVDEILFAIQDLVCENVNWEYWQQVRKEIEWKNKIKQELNTKNSTCSKGFRLGYTCPFNYSKCEGCQHYKSNKLLNTKK